MSIEEYIIKYLNDVLTVPCYGNVPDLGTVEKFVTVEKVGSSTANHIRKASIAVQSWALSRAEADKLNEEVKPWMERLIEKNEISRCHLDTDYNYPDLVHKRGRYQALFEVVFDL